MALQVHDDVFSISNPCAGSAQTVRYAAAPFGQETGFIVDMEMSPDESMIAVACLRLKHHAIRGVRAFMSEIGDLMVHVFTMPGGQRLHQVSSSPGYASGWTSAGSP